MGFLGGLFKKGHPKDVIDNISVDKVFQNPYQPRRVFNKESMEQLKSSIKQHGVLVPIMVRKVEYGYELACGERRLRACKELGIKKIPAVIKQLTTPQMVELALIENVIRTNLTPLEEADTYDRLSKEFSVSSEKEIAQRFGLSGPAVERYKRLAGLPMILKMALLNGLITEEHAMILSDIQGEESLIKFLSIVIKQTLSPDQLRLKITAERIDTHHS